MKIIRWDPYTLADVDDLFQWPKSIGLDLAVDVYEENSNIIAIINVPGIDPEKIDINIEDTLLKVTGKREEEKEIKEKNYYSKEIKRGSFERTIELPNHVDEKNTKAEFKDGVLKIIMPKKSAAQHEKIKIAINKK